MSTFVNNDVASGNIVYASDHNTQGALLAAVLNGGLDNDNIAANSAIAGSKLADDSVTPAKLSNVYQFRVSRNAAANSGNGAFAKLAFDIEQFDDNSNFATGTYTVPVTGSYHFSWLVTSAVSASIWIASIMKTNGGATELSRGTEIRTALNPNTSGGSDTIKLTAGDTIEVHVFGNTTLAVQVGDIYRAYFSGFLVSQT